MRYLSHLILSIGLFIPLPSHAETITIVADQWCPYNCEPNSKNPGFMIEIAQAAFNKHDIDVIYDVMPWERAINNTRDNKFNAIVGAAQEDAPDFVFPSNAQGWISNFFYTKVDNKWQFTGLESLNKISLGVIGGYTYDETLNKYIKQHKNNHKFIQIVYGDKGLEVNIKKLLANRIDAIIEGEYVMQYTLSKNGLTDLIKQSGAIPPSESNKLFIAFSPKNPNSKKYAELLSQEMSAMRASGELKIILDKYNIKDWQN